MMQQAPKNRTISVELTTANQDLYTVPNNYEAYIVSIVFSNATSTEKKFSLDWYRAETATWYTIAEQTPILGYGVVQFENTLWLKKSDKLRGLADANSSITITLHLKEFFAPLQSQT